MPKSAVMAVVLSPLACPMGQTGALNRASIRLKRLPPTGLRLMALSPSRGRPALEGDARATTGDRDGFQVVRAIPDSRLAGATANRGCVPVLRPPPVVELRARRRARQRGRGRRQRWRVRATA